MHLCLCVTNSAHINLIKMPENENDESQVRISTGVSNPRHACQRVN